MMTRDCLSILGVRIANLSRGEAVTLIEDIVRKKAPAQSIFLANAHTLNLATGDPSYRAVLNSATWVFADGTGTRIAAWLRGTRLRANLVGTDLIPSLFDATAGRGYRYYLLGARDESLELAVQFARRRFSGWTLAGRHHGYFDRADQERVIDDINTARPDMLLVGMGNPDQERWIAENMHDLRVPVLIGVGGLFNHWSADLKRAPVWVRRLGCEWLQILAQQPYKWRRYVLGNPAFLARIILHWRRDLLKGREVDRE